MGENEVESQRGSAGGHGSTGGPADTPGDGAAPASASEQSRGWAGSVLTAALELWRNPAYRFVLLFLPFLVVVSVGYPLVVKHFNPVIQAFIHATALIEFWLFDLFSDEVRHSGKLVVFGGFAVKIIDECTGIYEMLIFTAAVLAFPTGAVNKGLGVLLGNPLIYLFNVIRIAGLIWVGRYYPPAFDFMHLYFWQATMIVMITSVWLLWIVYVVRAREDQPPPAPD